MLSDDKLYYSERAAIERQRAAESANPHVVEIHEKLADLYERLVEMDEGQAPDLKGSEARASLDA